jgi:histidine triad (HIT) family protein
LCGAIETEQSSDTGVVILRPLVERAPVHLLAVPIRHYDSVAEMVADDPEIIGRLAREAMTQARARGIDRTGFRLVMNSGPDTDQVVAHPHLHIVGGTHLAAHP